MEMTFDNAHAYQLESLRPCKSQDGEGYGNQDAKDDKTHDVEGSEVNPWHYLHESLRELAKNLSNQHDEIAIRLDDATKGGLTDSAVLGAAFVRDAS